jgi:hypothetical protein
MDPDEWEYEYHDTETEVISIHFCQPLQQLTVPDLLSQLGPELPPWPYPPSTTASG